MWYTLYMVCLITKWFKKWMSNNNIKKEDLFKGISDLKENKGVSSLGANLYKLRIKSEKKGKSGSYRALIVYIKDYIVLYFSGYKKSEKSNLTIQEKKDFKKYAKSISELDEKNIIDLINEKKFFKLEEKNE